METKGMCVKGLDAYELSRKLEKYVADIFTGYKLNEGKSLFAEGHLFYLEEIDSALPENYLQLFTDDDKFTCMCGFFDGCGTQDGATERTINLVMDEEGEYAYLLCLLETDERGEERSTIIKDFLAQGHREARKGRG